MEESPQPTNTTERIRGIRINLGRLTLPEFEQLETHCVDRLEDARSDLMIVQDYRERLFPDAQHETVTEGAA